MEESKDKDKDGLPEPEFKKDLESKEEKVPYPKSVFFIVINEFCERFSYYGMKAVLTLYLNSVLGFSEDDATVIYHTFSMFAYFTPLLGAMLADSLLGKFKTIFYLSVVYAAGNIVLSLAATTPISGGEDGSAIWMSMLGLALIALGTGGIKPCVAAFGGDQFILPQQAAQLVTFFSFFYMAINSGSLISTAITPIMRSSVQCFDQDSCYTLAFAVPAALMIVALLVFLLGKPLYREVKPSGNVVVKLCKCIGHAISRKRKASSKKEHWLDHADDEYEQRFIEDVKIVLRILVLYLPLPFFWALFDQQGSRWTLQATRMDGVVAGITIQPDQVQVLNPALILIFIPLFDNLIYPLLAKCNLLKKPLQRLTVGGILAGIAFIISGVVELELEKTYPTNLARTEANLNFINTLPCEITLDGIPIPANGAHLFEKMEAGIYCIHPENENPPPGCVSLPLNNYSPCVDGSKTFTLANYIQINATKSPEELKEQDGTEEADNGGGFTYLITFNTKDEIKLAYNDRSDDREKPKAGKPKLRFLLGGEYFLTEDTTIPQGKLSVYVEGKGGDNHEFVMKEPALGQSDPTKHNVGVSSETIEVSATPHKIKLIYGGKDDVETHVVDFPQEFNLKLGASYIISISHNAADTINCPTNTIENFKNAECYSVILNTITKESSLHMFWLLPQYIVITAGEIMFSITGLEFSYSQAPVSMKSVMQSAWLLTVAFGNLIVIIIAELKFFEEQSKEFFLFAGLMFADMIVFAYMAYRYVPAQLEDPNKKKEDD